MVAATGEDFREGFERPLSGPENAKETVVRIVIGENELVMRVTMLFL
jgi:hypothetical protein